MRNAVFIGVLLLGIGTSAELFLENLPIKNGPIGFGNTHTLAGMICSPKGVAWNLRIDERNCENIAVDLARRVSCQDVTAMSDSNLKAYDLNGATLLHLAAAEGDAEVVEYLLDRGFPVDARTEDADTGYRDVLQTPLHFAAATGHVRVLGALVQRGANISAITDCGDTALHKAALNGRVQAVRWLLQHGADANARNIWGATPKDMAVVNQAEGVAEILLERTPSKGWPLNREEYSSPLHLLLECTLLLLVKKFFT